MARLFVAADLPDTAISKLIGLQPPQTPGIRLTQPCQMHLTLHFLGEADIAEARVALQSIVVSEFLLTFAGVGEFPSSGGGTIAWAGVEKSDALIRLHTAVGDALATIGFQPESRPYTPHITLARCTTGHGSLTNRDYLVRQKDFRLPDQLISTIGLYSSVVVGQSRDYRCEQMIPLIGRAAG